MPIRRIARILWVGETKTRHFIGFPTGVGHPSGPQRDLASARILLLHPKMYTNGYFLERFAADSSFAGDTWHRDIAEAERQATFEYGDALGPWEDIPSTVDDEEQFAIQYACENVPKNT